MGLLAGAALARVESGEVEWGLLAETLLRLLEEKQLQVYMTEPVVEERLSERGWDGGLRPVQGDFLFPVEANLGYNKASTIIRRAWSYTVDLAQSPPLAELTLVYTHTSAVNYPCKPEVRYDPVYVQMMDRCYWAYLRLYLPEGARLVEASRHLIPAVAMWDGETWLGFPVEEAPERDHTVLAQAFLLPTASRVALHFVYELPAGVLQEEPGGVFHYHLDVQKQAGLDIVPVDISLRLPPNAVLLESQPQPTSQPEGVLVYRFDLREDSSLSVRYRVPEGDE